MHIETKHVTLNGTDLFYRMEGEGPLVALVHGVGGRLNLWDGVVERLRERYRILRYDLRGHGRSGKPPGPYSIDLFAGDFVALLDHLSIERCHLAGFSLGALIAQKVAIAHPARVDRLALLAGVAGRTPEEKARVMERLRIVADEIPGQHFANSISRWFTDEFREANPELIAAYAAANQANDPVGYAASYRVLATTDLAEDIHRIEAKTLIVTGENDLGSNPRMAHLMHERISRSKLRILPRLRHSILIEAPDVIAELLDGFLSGDAHNAHHV